MTTQSAVHTETQSFLLLGIGLALAVLLTLQLIMTLLAISCYQSPLGQTLRSGLLLSVQYPAAAVLTLTCLLAMALISKQQPLLAIYFLASPAGLLLVSQELAKRNPENNNEPQ